MSQADDNIHAANAKCAEDCHNAAVEHMQELERQRAASESARKNSVHGTWEALRAKRKPKVLGGLLPVQLK